jgi:small subunit ribosomal protein S9
MDTVHTIGRRKTSVARIFVSEGKGAITVNKKKYTDYFPTPTLQYKIQQPFILTNTEGKLRFKCNGQRRRNQRTSGSGSFGNFQSAL